MAHWYTGLCEVATCRGETMQPAPLDPMQRRLCPRHVALARVLLRERPGMTRHELLDTLDKLASAEATHGS